MEYFARTNVVHLIIKGKRPLTVKAAERIAEALAMGALARRYFTTMVEYLYSNDAAKRSDLFNQMLQMKNQVVRSNMSRSQLSYFSEWYHPVVREMISLKHFKPDPAWIAQKMRPHIRKDHAEKSLKLLQDLGLVAVRPDGKVEATAANVTTGDEVKSIALVRYQYAVIDLARNAIPSVEPRMRDVSAVTIAVSQDTVKEIKAEIQAFRKRILAIVDRRRLLSGLSALGLTSCIHLDRRPAPSVVVVGAGMAGLSAARRLHDAGCRVTVVEARARVGGRIWSQPDAPGQVLELGASWIHGHVDNPVARLAATAGIATQRTDDDAYPAMFTRDGAPVREPEQRSFYAALKGLRANLRARRDALALSSVDPSLASSIEAEIAALRASGTADEAAIAGLRHLVVTEIEGAYAENVTRLSLRHWRRGASFDGDDLLVEGGYGRILEVLAKGLDVRLSSEVVAVKRSAGGVQVVLRSGGVLDAEHVIVTLPLGVLKAETVVFDPPLPERKRAAIARLGFGVFDKLYLRFSSRFWPADRSWIQFMGQPADSWPLFFNVARYGGAPILVAFHTGDAARRLAQRSDAEAASDARRALEIIGRHERWRVEPPVAAHRTRWGHDPWALGSYSHVPPGGSLSDYDEVGSSVGGRLHFAGEATSSRHFMTVHAAHISGETAARTILESSGLVAAVSRMVLDPA